MESPFYPSSNSMGSHSVTMYLEPILNSYFQTYHEIITLTTMPAGPIGDMVKMVSFPKLSPFQESSTYSRNGRGGNCAYTLLRYPAKTCGMGSSSIKNMDYYMTADDIPAIFSYLESNGYIIESGLTEMMNRSRVLMGGISETRFSGDRRMICIFSYRM